MLLKLKKVKPITGVPAGEAKASLFVMAHIRAQNFSPLHLPLRKPTRCIYVAVKKRGINHFVTALMPSSKEWENRYQENKAHWDRGEISPNLLYWLESGLLKPCRILIPGCGNGYEALALAERGFDVVAIDIAPTPIENLKKALQCQQLSAELIQTDFFTWINTELFDAIYEQTSLCALHPDDWQHYENCLYDWLKPNGKLFAQFMQTGVEGGPPYHCDVSAMTNLFNTQRWLWSKQHVTQVIHSVSLHEKVFLLDKVV
jgi:SAM-dependent methyltransferase